MDALRPFQDQPNTASRPDLGITHHGRLRLISALVDCTSCQPIGAALDSVTMSLTMRWDLLGAHFGLGTLGAQHHGSKWTLVITSSSVTWALLVDWWGQSKMVLSKMDASM